MALNNLVNSPFPTIVAKGGTGLSSLTSHGVLVGNGTGNVVPLAEAANGQLIIGSTGNAPVLASLSAGAGISVTPGAGSITIANTQTALSWVNQTAATVTMSVNTGYVNTSTASAQVTYTLPATAALGSTFKIMGKSTGGWVLQANTAQVINVGEVATAATGSVTNGGVFDTIEVICITADSVFAVASGVTAGYNVI